MKRIFVPFLLAMPLFLMGFFGCAHQPPPEDLLWARNFLKLAREAKSPQYAPNEYLAGSEAVREAEKAWAGNLFVYEDEIRHKVLMARVRAEIAYLAGQERANRQMLEQMNYEWSDLAYANGGNLKQKYEQLSLKERELREKEEKLAHLESELAKAQHRLSELEKEREAMRQQLRAVVETIGEIRESDRGLIVSLSNILFEFDRADLKEGAKKNLIQLARILRQYPDRSILLEGHTDSIGSEAYNNALSKKRALAVEHFLISMGIPDSKLYVRGYGRRYPVASNATQEGRQQNRRVDMVILDTDRQALESFLDSPGSLKR